MPNFRTPAIKVVEVDYHQLRLMQEQQEQLSHATLNSWQYYSIPNYYRHPTTNKSLEKEFFNRCTQ